MKYGQLGIGARFYRLLVKCTYTTGSGVCIYSAIACNVTRNSKNIPLVPICHAKDQNLDIKLAVERTFVTISRNAKVTCANFIQQH